MIEIIFALFDQAGRAPFGWLSGNFGYGPSTAAAAGGPSYASYAGLGQQHSAAAAAAAGVRASLVNKRQPNPGIHMFLPRLVNLFRLGRVTIMLLFAWLSPVLTVPNFSGYLQGYLPMQTPLTTCLREAVKKYLVWTNHKTCPDRAHSKKVCKARSIRFLSNYLYNP